MTDTGNEDTLVSRSRQGDMAAYGQLVHLHQDRLFNALYRLVGDYEDARELTQESFVRAMQAIRRFRGDSRFYTWLLRIGTNLAFNRLRRRPPVPFSVLQGRENQPGDQAAALRQLRDQNTPDPQQHAAIREGHKKVLIAMAALEPNARAVVVLRDIEELDYAEIAAVLEVPVGTVKSRLFRARKALRDQLGQTE